jgi:hypothetical protein
MQNEALGLILGFNELLLVFKVKQRDIGRCRVSGDFSSLTKEGTS